MQMSLAGDIAAETPTPKYHGGGRPRAKLMHPSLTNRVRVGKVTRPSVHVEDSGQQALGGASTCFPPVCRGSATDVGFGSLGRASDDISALLLTRNDDHECLPFESRPHRPAHGRFQKPSVWFNQCLLGNTGLVLISDIIAYNNLLAPCSQPSVVPSLPPPPRHFAPLAHSARLPHYPSAS